MDYRNILATGFLLLCAGYFFRSLQPANAVLPPYPVGTSYNSFPYESFTGEINAGQTIDLLTIPNDKVFIITTAEFITYSGSQTIDIYENSTLLMDASIGTAFEGVLAQGKGRLPISSGSTLRLIESDNWSNGSYYLEGYYAEATNNPYLSFSDAQQTFSDLAIMTVPSNKKFVITTLQSDNTGTTLKENSTVIIDRILPFNSGTPGAFKSGNGNLIIESGSTLYIQSNSGSINYYLEGYLIDS